MPLYMLDMPLYQLIVEYLKTVQAREETYTKCGKHMHSSISRTFSYTCARLTHP